LSKSWKYDAASFSILYTNFLPFPKTEVILQVLHAGKRLKELGKEGRIIIKTSDTDVIVLCIHFDKQIQTSCHRSSINNKKITRSISICNTI
jgi:hypothetical protein